MKTKKFWSTLMVLAFVALPAVTFTSCGGDDDDDSSASKYVGTENGIEWVDLGLSVNWATYNVGASRPEEYGNYYAWGETEIKSSCTEKNYTYDDNTKILPLSADVANVKWAGRWRMPTEKELDELMDETKCSRKWITKNGVNGWEVRSIKTGKSIFLPAAGYFTTSLEDAGSYGSYWSSSLYTKNTSGAYNLSLRSNGFYRSSVYRYYGHSVRPVCPK